MRLYTNSGKDKKPLKYFKKIMDILNHAAEYTVTDTEIDSLINNTCECPLTTLSNILISDLSYMGEATSIMPDDLIYAGYRDTMSSRLIKRHAKRYGFKLKHVYKRALTTLEDEEW